MDHTKVGELLVTLEHDDTSTIIDLLDKPGDPTPGMCTGNNVDGTFDDDAADIAESDCADDPADPALGGSFQPNESLSNFDSESLNGDWTLKVVDRTSGSFSGTPSLALGAGPSLALGASFVSWCLTASGPTADAGGTTPVADALAPLNVSTALTVRPFANLVFSAAARLAAWLVDRVQVHASVLADGRAALIASPPSGEVWRSYYGVYPERTRGTGGQRIAMRVQEGSGDEVYYLLGDHLGSTTVTADGEGVFHSETRYGPWGDVLAQSGATPTDYTYTGQFSYADDFGLLYYVARFYDPYLGRFAQADSIVPGVGDPGAFDRYAGMGNNPVKFNDPSGHVPQCYSADGMNCKGQKGGQGSSYAQQYSSICNTGYLGEGYCDEHSPAVKTCEYNNSCGKDQDSSENYDASSPIEATPPLVALTGSSSEVGGPAHSDEIFERPWYEDVLAWQYTPLLFSAINVLATDAAFLGLVAAAAGNPAGLGVFAAGWAIGRAASVVSLVATGYQYEHNLFGTTKNDLIINAATTVVGAIPKPDMAVANHVSFVYTFLRTFKVIGSP